MSTPNPLVPQGTFADKGKSHVRVAVFTILAIHVVLLSALLIAGCKRTTTEEQLPDPTAVTPPLPPPIEPPMLPPPIDANLPPVAPPPVVDIVQPPPPPIIAETPGQEHVIVKGDIFATMATKYHVSVNAIKQANPNLNPNRLKIGDKVTIPAATGITSAQPGGASPAADKGKTYKVKSGDNLTKIAKAHGTTVKALRAANNLSTDQIKVGQALKIPSKSTPVSPAPAPAPAPIEPAPVPAPATPVPFTPPAGTPSNI